MDFENGFLRLECQAAEPQQVLDGAMLGFMNILEHPEVDALVIVDGEERFLDPVDFSVRHNDDIEEIPIKAEQEFPLREIVEKNQDSEHYPAHAIFLNVENPE